MSNLKRIEQETVISYNLEGDFVDMGTLIHGDLNEPRVIGSKGYSVTNKESSVRRVRRKGLACVIRCTYTLVNKELKYNRYFSDLISRTRRKRLYEGVLGA